eukprot:6020273-Prymnesium_polylepis.1
MRVRKLSSKVPAEPTVRDGTRFRQLIASICVSDAEAFTYERECNSSSFTRELRVRMRRIPMVRFSFRSFTCRLAGTAPRGESAVRLSQLYVAWRERGSLSQL